MPETRRTRRTPAATSPGARRQSPGVAQEDRLSPVAENYLLSLYVLREEGVSATPRRLADYLESLPAGEQLGTSLPSVAGMLRRMAREGLVGLAPTKEIRLTDLGEALAEDMVRRHRLAECMVVELLGVDLHRAHMEAHRLEHAISPELLAKINERLGQPAACPFGRPIPGNPAQGMNSSLRLSQGAPRTRYLIARVPEEDHALLQFLVEQRLLPHQEVTVAESAPYRGVVAVLGPLGREVALGLEAADRIWVHPAAEPND